MRLWSVHPKLLDKAGLGAVWREGLLARAVLNNQTKGYKNHPQLQRFKANKTHSSPLELIDSYLNAVCDEAVRRGYNYDRTKLKPSTMTELIEVTAGQLEYEFQHLQRKLEGRSKPHTDVVVVPAHPLFVVVPGNVEAWEKVS